MKACITTQKYGILKKIVPNLFKKEASQSGTTLRKRADYGTMKQCSPKISHTSLNTNTCF